VDDARLKTQGVLDSQKECLKLEIERTRKKLDRAKKKLGLAMKKLARTEEKETAPEIKFIELKSFAWRSRGV